MRRTLAVCALALAVSSCTTDPAGPLAGPDSLDEIAEQTGLAAREFESTLNLFGRQVRVIGVAADSYRYAATVFLESRPLFEEVAIDDARYLRVLDAETIRAAAAATDGAEPLLSGAWVVDPGGAPPEFGEGAASSQPDPAVVAASPTFAADLLSSSTVLETVRALERVPSLLEKAERVREWNTDAADYLEADDLFPPHEQDGTRFDALPKAFDPSASIRGIESLEPFFRTSAIWTRDGFITRIESTFRFPRPGDGRYDALFRSFAPETDPNLPATAALASRGTELLRSLADLELSESQVFRRPPAGAEVRAPAAKHTIDLEAVLRTLRGAPAVEGPEVPAEVDLPADIADLVPGAGS